MIEKNFKKSCKKKFKNKNFKQKVQEKFETKISRKNSQKKFQEKFQTKMSRKNSQKNFQKYTCKLHDVIFRHIIVFRYVPFYFLASF